MIDDLSVRIIVYNGISMLKQVLVSKHTHIDNINNNSIQINYRYIMYIHENISK